MAEMGKVSVRIGVTAEPSQEFSNVAYALGFVRIVPCFDCSYRGTSDCPMNDDVRNYSAYCSFGKRKDDGE